MDMALLIKAGIIGGLIVAGLGYRYILKKADNIFEQTAEDLIKDATGFEIDFSPDVEDEDHKCTKDKK